MTGKNRTRLVGLGESAGWGMKMNGRRENCGWDVLHKNLFSIKKRKERKYPGDLNLNLPQITCLQKFSVNYICFIVSKHRLSLLLYK